MDKVLGFVKKKQLNIEDILPPRKVKVVPQELGAFSAEQMKQVIIQYEEYCTKLPNHVLEFKSNFLKLQQEKKEQANKIQELEERCKMLREDLSASMITLEKYEMEADAKFLISDYLSFQIRRVFSPTNSTSIQDFFESHKGAFAKVRQSASEYAQHLHQMIGTISGSNQNAILGRLTEFQEAIDEIDQNNMDNLEMINNNVEQIQSSISEIQAEICKRFGEKNLSFDNRKLAIITDKKQTELVEEKSNLKLALKELKISLSKSEKFVEGLLEENSGLKELLKENAISLAQGLASSNHQNFHNQSSQNTPPGDQTYQSDNAVMSQQLQGQNQMILDQKMELEQLRNTRAQLLQEIQQNKIMIEQYQMQIQSLQSLLTQAKGKLSNSNMELETFLKQEKLSHEQTKKDLHALEIKYQETNNYLTKEVVRSNQTKKENKELTAKALDFDEKIGILRAQINVQESKISELLQKLEDQNQLKEKLQEKDQLLNEYSQTEKIMQLLKTERDDLIASNQHQEVQVAKIERELDEMRKLTEEQAENINSLQNELQSSRKNLKIVEQKRENGRLEISRLREKIDDLKQKSMNQSLNSSFNLDMVHVTDTSVHLEPNQVQDMLENMLEDLQKLYKETVMMLPLEDYDKNMTLISVERKINGLITLVCDNMSQKFSSLIHHSLIEVLFSRL